MAYQINGQRKGTYWLTYFDMDSAKLTEFNRACQLNANVLRHLLLKHDDRLAETLVAHALGESVAPAPVEAEKEAVAVPAGPVGEEDVADKTDAIADE